MLRKSCRLIAVLLIVVTVFGMSSFAMAGNVCTLISGNAKKTSTFTVTTTKRWLGSDKLTLSQSKGTANWTAWAGADKNHSMYAAYYVTYSKIVKGKETNTKSVAFNSASKTIKLDKNSTYKFTVTPVTVDYYTWNGHFSWGAMNKWVKAPSWSIKTTKGIATCQ